MPKDRSQGKPIASRVPLARPRPEFGPPRYQWEKELRAAAGQPAINAAAGKAPAVKQSRFRVTDMALARATAQDRLGSPTDEKVDWGPLTYVPTSQQKQFLADELSRRAMPTQQLKDLKFVAGLDKDAGPFTRIAYGSLPEAVTQGSTVYVRPDKFPEVAGFRSATPFEEAYHSAQFAADGGGKFYPHYGLGGAAGLLSMADWYGGNPYEAFAKGASKEMLRAYQARKSNGR